MTLKIIKKSAEELQVFVDWAKGVLQKDFVVESVPHGDQSNVLKLCSEDGNYFLKIAPALEKEKVRLEWLSGRVSVPRVIGFSHLEGQDVLLLSEIVGENLARLKKEWNATDVVRSLADAVKAFHAIDITGCPFGDGGSGKVLVHGDACLPNLIFKDRTFVGYIDLGGVAVDSPDVDLAAGVWTLQHNLGPGYGKEFLERYGIADVTDDTVEMLRQRYEGMIEAWGFSK